MSFWTEIHWSEGMFLRPHHLQVAQRWMETVIEAGLNSARSFAYGFAKLEVAEEPLENSTLRLDGCSARMKDGTWVQIPENTQVDPLNFKKALEAKSGAVNIYFGIPEMQEVRSNSVSLENPEATNGTPRYEPHPVMRRDENTGENPQMVYVRRMRGRLFAEGEDMTGYETLRVGVVRRTDRPGAVPELDALGAGPLLAVQAHAGLSGMITSLANQVEGKVGVLAQTAQEHRMLFTDGVAENMEHLLKLHTLNDMHAQFQAMLQSYLLHPFDVFQELCRMIGQLSIFHEDRVPGVLPKYDHDHPGECLNAVRNRLVTLLDAVLPHRFVARPFVRKKDQQNHEGLEVELDRSWIDENAEMYVALQSEEMDDIHEVERFIYNRINIKLASPKRAPRISSIAVRGLRLQIKAVPAGTLPRRQGLHYFKIEKTIGPDRIDYWQECEQERGIRIGVPEGQIAAIEKFQPALYVPKKDRS